MHLKTGKEGLQVGLCTDAEFFPDAAAGYLDAFGALVEQHGYFLVFHSQAHQDTQPDVAGG